MLFPTTIGLQYVKKGTTVKNGSVSFKGFSFGRYHVGLLELFDEKKDSVGSGFYIGINFPPAKKNVLEEDIEYRKIMLP